MRILLTNDDGITHPGLLALHKAINGDYGHDPLGDITAVAPNSVQSATSHGLTFDRPLMTQTVRVNDTDGISVDGRPADCTKLALTNLWPEKFGAGERPDLVVSGLNSGANVGINVIYSGTVAAAIEAAFLGVPSIAMSLHLDKAEPDYDLAARHARRVIDAILAGGPLNPHECISVNIPATEHLAKMGGHASVVVCPMNTHPLVDKYERRTNPAGETYYWAAGHGLDFRDTDAGTDVYELFERNITLTPLQFDMTSAAGMTRWRDRIAAWHD